MSSDYKTIIKYFLTWRITLFLIAFFSFLLIPKFGARFPYYDSALQVTGLPNWIWGFGNFDGVHYLRIAQNLYLHSNSQAFFPLFPLLVRFFAFVFPTNNSLDHRIFVDPSFFYSGILLSNLFFALALIVFYKLISLDFDRKTVFKSLLLLLAFPTAFYFGSIYTESLFLFLCVVALLLLRNKNFLLASLIIGLASATRITGIFLVVIYLIEITKEKLDWKKVLGIFISLSGIAIYMYYLYINYSNPIYFITSQASFGANRLVNGIVLFPQILYRYFKIFLAVPTFSLSFFIAFLELAFSVLSLGYTFMLYKKMRTSYWVFTICVLITPTLTGTFSSMPRYVLGAFLILPFLAQSKYFKLLLLVFTVLGIILLSLFIRGYWVA